MVDLLDKDIKTTVLKMLKELKEDINKASKQCMNKMEMSKNRKCKNKPKELL